jgi:hypothetical protein
VPPTLAGKDEHRLTAELVYYISNLDIEVRYYTMRGPAAEVCVERWMQFSVREFITAIHGLLFGGVFILGTFGVVVELIRSAYATEASKLTDSGRSLASFYLSITAALGWAAVLAGTYIVYPWYRAVPPAGTTNLTGFPKSLLLASSATSGWHNLGMEWKEYVAWLAPTAITMVAYIWTKQRPAMKRSPQVGKAVLVFALVAFAAAGAAGLFGAMINKKAPVKGGSEIHLLTEH